MAGWYIQHIRQSFQKDYSLALHLHTTTPFHNGTAHAHDTWQAFGYMHALHFRPFDRRLPRKELPVAAVRCIMLLEFWKRQLPSFAFSGCFESFYRNKLATQEARLLLRFW
jgi:hypothetical protein